MHVCVRAGAHGSVRAHACVSDYKTKPQRLLSHCMGHEGDGSILAVLKRLGYATELVAGTGSISISQFSIFQARAQNITLGAQSNTFAAPK